MDNSLHDRGMAGKMAEKEKRVFPYYLRKIF